ncbi:MAG: amino acid permease [Acidobacteria bacterium]|nr:amino acid permease [Acidobacteriota bacterium]MBU4307362.1 amino acid permease [Acidobacteriota bacterium]MBU4408670.1 amino acid permease [Pseudomonadota bacterium]MCG2810519.1 amino acid permease [Candidatus Aminicenantes bacterium]
MNGIEAKKPIELLRQVGLITAIAFAIGSVIGSGIFKKPGLMASQLESPLLLLLVWVVAGLMTLFGTLSIAEISGMFPQAGGQYIYFNKSYGDFAGYLYGWAVFIVIQTGSIASIAYVFSDSLGYFFIFPRLGPAWEAFALHIPWVGAITPFKFIGLKGCTILLILFLTVINYLGVRFGSAIQVIFTSLKVAVILALVALSFAIGHGSLANFTQSAVTFSGGYAPVFLAFIIAMSGAFWAYDGWINLTYLAGEIKNPQKNLPRAMIIATLVFISVYLLINLAYFYIIPVHEMGSKYLAAESTGQSYLVATDVASSLFGGWGGSLIAVAIMISTFGTVNGTLMMSARVYYAMAKEKLFFKKLQYVHPRFRTPGPSLIVQGIWTSVLILSGTFDQLTDMLIFVSWIFYAAAALSVIVLRRKLPDHERPYRVWGYPFVPVLFIIFATIYVVFTLYSDIVNFSSGRAPLINSLLGLLLVAAGIPGYLFWKRRKAREDSCE